ncbi:MAG: RNA polymerase sigma factor [Alistipes putredinis]
MDASLKQTEYARNETETPRADRRSATGFPLPLRLFPHGSQADAEDIVQDVLLRLFHSDCNLDRIDDVERYLWRAIANRCCDYHRHRRNATLPTERAAALADDSGDQELREEYERIAGLLATLPEEQAEVIRLKTSDSLTFARIAELTGSTEATVKSRFRYGIGKPANS